MHRLSWVEQGEIDALARDFFIHALIDMGACYLLYDEKGRCICITRLPDRWGGKPTSAPSDESIFGAEIADRLADLRRGLKEPGEQSEIEVSLENDNVFAFRCGKVNIPKQGNYFILSITDRTEARRREKQLSSLLMEVSHRSKNLLAIVQSIASQTARFTASLDDFLSKFRGRLYALSQSQDLVTESSWRGAAFMELLDKQISRYVAENPGAIEVSGENLMLSPNAATHVGLALHELVVNAVAHGNLLKAAGTVHVSCRRIETPHGPEVRLEWIERFASAMPLDVARPENFGATVLGKVVPASVNGKAVHKVSRHGISYELTFPAEMIG